MAYKVVLVEDEIVTREGIRDNVDWRGNGFEFCGEASDGEIALPLLESSRPDVLITDIKMPFMDGLQLARIVRERMPALKIVILSGHDEFEYAQEAIKIGVMEYLLKPVSVQDMHSLLRKVAGQLARERKDEDVLRELKERAEKNQLVLREKFLLRLVVGAVSSAEAIQQAEQFGIDLVARCYLVAVIRTGPYDHPEAFDYRQYQQVQEIVANAVGNNPDIFFLEKGLEELLLIFKGNTCEYLQEENDMLLERIRRKLDHAGCKYVIGVGSSKERITELYQSYVEASVNRQTASGASDSSSSEPVDKKELLKLDKSAVETYLRSGVTDGFDAFFEHYVRPLAEISLRSAVIKNYLFMDIVLATAQFVNSLGGNIDHVIPDLGQIGAVLTSVKTLSQFKELAQNVLVSALLFRDSRKGNPYGAMIRQAKQYLEQHYANANLSLGDVASQVSLSPSHFCTVFSQETGKTFKEYLTELRIAKAKELLRTTILRSFEIAEQIGYNDPHYFSFVFRKMTGLSPKEFRQETQAG